jgi:hypothetical protein
MCCNRYTTTMGIGELHATIVTGWSCFIEFVCFLHFFGAICFDSFFGHYLTFSHHSIARENLCFCLFLHSYFVPFCEFFVVDQIWFDIPHTNTMILLILLWLLFKLNELFDCYCYVFKFIFCVNYGERVWEVIWNDFHYWICYGYMRVLSYFIISNVSTLFCLFVLNYYCSVVIIRQIICGSNFRFFV